LLILLTNSFPALS